MRGTPLYVGSNLAGGLNTRDAPYEVSFTQARDLLNVVGTVNGAVRKRDGSVSLTTSLTGTPTTLYPIEATATRYLLWQGGTVFDSIDNGGTIVARTGGTVPTAGLPWSFVQAPASGGQGPVYGGNGTDTPQQWTGAGNLANWTASSGTLPNGKYLAFVNNRVWVAGMTAYGSVADPGSTVVFSAVGDPRTWPAANVVQFDPNDGDAITGLGTFGPYLLVFKRRKTFVVYNLDTGANRRLSADIGCCAARSIAESPLGTYFLTLDRGVYRCNGSTLTDMSDIIRPSFAALDVNARSLAAGAFFNKHYYLSVSAGGVNNDTTYDFDSTLESWWKHSLTAYQMAVWRPTGVDQRLYIGPPTTGRVDQVFVPSTPTDRGSGFSAQWTSGWMSPSFYRRRYVQSPEYRKNFRGVRFQAQGQISLSYAQNFVGALTAFKDYNFSLAGTLFGGAGTFGGTGTFGDTSVVSEGRAYNFGVANAISLSFGTDAANPNVSNSTLPWELENYILLTTDRKD